MSAGFIMSEGPQRILFIVVDEKKIIHRFLAIFRKLVSIVGLGMGNIFGLMLRFMPTWWSFLIFWILMMGTIHAAHISASVYETESILQLNHITTFGVLLILKIEVKLLKWWVLPNDIMVRVCQLLLELVTA